MREEKMLTAGVAINDMLDEAGLTAEEQIACLGRALGLALATMPAEERKRHLVAHIAGLAAITEFEDLVRQ